MTLHENILDVVRTEVLTAGAIAGKLLLPLQVVCQAVAELQTMKRLKCAGKIWVRKGRLPTTVPTYTIVTPRPKRDKHADKMNRLRRDFFGGEA